MPPTPLVVLEIDDNTPRDQPPFTNSPSMWNFHRDWNLGTRTAASAFRKLHDIAGGGLFRGFPVGASEFTIKFFEERCLEPAEVTWLTAAEISGNRSWVPEDFPETEVQRTLKALAGTVDVVASQFGLDRVRLVFAFL